MQPWKKKKGLMRQARYSVVFEAVERDLLAEVATTVSAQLMQRARSAPSDPLAELTGIPTGHKEAPQDPALARLLPDFERPGDEEYEGDNALLRSLHETDIIRDKLRNLQVIIEALGPDGGESVSATEEEAHAWLGGLNDIRLFVVEQRAGDAREQQGVVEWLAYNQESLLTAMMGS